MPELPLFNNYLRLAFLKRSRPATNPDTGPRFQRAQVAWGRAKEIFTNKGQGKLQYKRVLGFGGFGMVQLWHVTDENGNLIREIAVKFPISTAEHSKVAETRNEIRFMRIFRNCEHITQLVQIGGNTQLDQEQLYNNTEAELPIIVMEVLPKGTLYDLISRINRARDFRDDNPTLTSQHKLGYVPNRVLWRIFLCLARAVIGFAYPPPDEARDQPAPYREKVNPSGAAPPRPSRFIHFDLDPGNVLVGDIDHAGLDQEHGLWDDSDPVDEKAWLLRRGKPRWHTPEQRNPLEYLDYYIGYPINVWAIGCIMFNLLTLRHPKATTEWVPYDREFKRDIYDPPVVPKLTWGWMLLDAADVPLEPFIQSYDIDLRLLIAQCMADDPEDRPDLSYLEYQIQWGINNVENNLTPRRAARADQDNADYGLEIWDVVQANEPDEIIRKFYDDHLRDPPDVQDPYENLWEAEL
ncbi:kinase-like protein [Hypoxylon sp. NC0597]|nr:kinase-like protein [Hypoxylon sp. NC0597]